jgi:hypothetical protein
MSFEPTDIDFHVLPERPAIPSHVDPDLKCKECGAYCELPESILSGYCCEHEHLRPVEFRIATPAEIASET